MCLITKQTVPEILEQDLIVYKLVRKYGNNKAMSPIYSMIWDMNVLYKRDIAETDDECPYDYQVRRCYEHTIKIVLKSYGTGLHACTELSRIKVSDFVDCVMVKGIIPKGSEVYRDETGLIVSNQLMLTEFIE